MKIRTGIQKDGPVEWDLGPIEWYPGELESVRKMARSSQWTIAWAKRLRKPVDGRCFKVVGGCFVRVKD